MLNEHSITAAEQIAPRIASIHGGKVVPYAYDTRSASTPGAVVVMNGVTWGIRAYAQDAQKRLDGSHSWVIHKDQVVDTLIWKATVTEPAEAVFCFVSNTPLGTWVVTRREVLDLCGSFDLPFVAIPTSKAHRAPSWHWRIGQNLAEETQKTMQWFADCIMNGTGDTVEAMQWWKDAAQQ